jgi:hypothetical protein
MGTTPNVDAMTAQLSMLGIVVGDMPTALRFYRLLGLGVLHVEAPQAVGAFGAPLDGRRSDSQVHAESRQTYGVKPRFDATQPTWRVGPSHRLLSRLPADRAQQRLSDARRR